MSGNLVNVRPKPGFVMDSGGNIRPMRDGLANILTGRGTSYDRAAHSFWHRRFSTSQQIEAAYLASWLHRKIVDIPALDMTRAGRDWDGDEAVIETIEAEEKRLGLWAKVREAITYARLGGGVILIGLGDDASQPLPANIRLGQLQYLTVLSRWQLSLGDMVTDPADPLFGQPRHFMLSGTSAQVKIHPSRVIVFKGLPVPAFHSTPWEDRFWGMSVVEAVDDAVRHADMATGGFATLIDEAKIDVYRMSGLTEMAGRGADGESTVLRRMELTNTSKSVHRAVLLDKDDEWEQRQLTWAGIPDVIKTYLAIVAGAADIPATRLLGKSPDGMNATGEGDMANYHQSIAAQQEAYLRPALSQLDAVMLASAGVRDRLAWAFSSLSVLTAQQEAEIEAKEAAAVTSYANSGLVPESAMAKVTQNRMIESGRWPGLQKALDEAALEPDDDDGDDLGVVEIGEGGGQASSGTGSGNGAAVARDE